MAGTYVQIRGWWAPLCLLWALTASPAHAADSLQWAWGNPTPGPDHFTSLAYDGASQYVAAGEDGVLYSSADGVNWTPEPSVLGFGASHQQIIHGGGHFVLGGMDAEDRGQLFTSTDGVHWTKAILSGGGTLIVGNLAFGDNAYIAYGGQTEFTSNDSLHWTAHSLSFFPSQIIAVGNVFVMFAVQRSGPGVLDFSDDKGVTWKPATSLANLVLQPVMYTDGTTLFLANFVGVASAQGIYSSTDGDHWTRRSSALNGLEFTSFMVWDGTQFLMINEDIHTSPVTSDVYTSTDGVTWTKGTATALEGTPTAIAAGGGYLALGSHELEVIQSSDFASWTTVFSGVSGPDINFLDIVHGGGKYVAIGQDDQKQAGVMESNDGRNWSEVYTGPANTVLKTIAYGNGHYVATGGGLWVSSSDGTSWSGIPHPPGAVLSQLVFGNGVFAAFTGCPSKCEAVASPDGQTWTAKALPDAMVRSDAYRDIGHIGKHLVAIGVSNPQGMAPLFSSDDGLTWASAGSFSVHAATAFTRLRELGDTLVAIGQYEQECVGQGSECTGGDSATITVMLATTHDGVTWSSGAPYDDNVDELLDVASDGHGYYGTFSTFSPNHQIAVSQDAIHWCPLSGTPAAAFFAEVLTTDGTQIVVAGGDGDILSTQPPTAGATNPPITCALATKPNGQPAASTAITGGGGGYIPMPLLPVLFGFLALRRRKPGRG